MMNLLKAIYRGWKYASRFCVDTLVTLTRRGAVRADRVLIVRLDEIGDFILWLDAAQAIAKHYKTQGKNVILVANATWGAWARELALFDDVIDLDKRGFEFDLPYRFRLGRRVRKLNCSITVQPTHSRQWFFGDAVVRMTGSPERIGSAGDTENIEAWQKRISDRWYTRLIFADPAPRMELVRNAEFVRGLGEAGFIAKLPDLRRIGPLRKDEAFVQSVPLNQLYYVLFPGASREYKQWPGISFAQVAERIYAQTGWHGVVCGSPADREMAERICARCSAPLLNWAGRTDLPQLATLLSTAQLLLTNDTSAAHIAPAVGVPTICIMGGAHFGRFMPYVVEQMDDRPLPRAITHQMPCFGCNWQCIYKPSSGTPVPCIEQITVTDVWYAISELIQPAGSGGRPQAGARTRTGAV
jgi:ADP-heptose:LPS heptosyltransferase